MRNKEAGWSEAWGEMVGIGVVTVLGQLVLFSLQIWPDVFSDTAQSPDPAPAEPLLPRMNTLHPPPATSDQDRLSDRHRIKGRR